MARPSAWPPERRSLWAIINSMTDGVSVLDERGVHLLVNDALCAMTGFSREELVGSGRPQPYWPGQDRAAIEAVVARVMAGESGAFEIVARRKDGATFPALVKASIVADEDTRMIVLVAQDLSEQRKRDGQLARLQRLVTTMLRSSDIATWDWYMGEGWAAVSDSYYTQLGYEPGAWMATHEQWAAHVHPDDLAGAEASLRALIAGETRLYDSEHRMLDANGEWRWILARAYVTERDADGKPTRLTGTHQDIHRSREHEAQLRQYQKMEVLGQLATGVAHDINNLLMAMQTHLEILRDLEPRDPDKHLREIDSALTSAANLTAALLRYAHNQPAAKTSLDLNAILREHSPVLRTGLPRGIQLTLTLDDGAGPICADRASIESAALNLVVNARDALGSSEGTIALATYTRGVHAQEAAAQGVAPGLYTCLRVSDDGCGMSEQVLARATEPLFTTKPVGVGTGLGLSMINKTVREADGFMAIESAPGEGTRVELALPVASMSEEGPAPGAATLAALDGTETIMLVAYEVGLLRSLATGLRSLGYHVLEAENPRLALAQLQQEPVDLLLTDIRMPYAINGVELAGRARGHHPELRVLFMTGYASPPEVEQAAALGEILAKPVSILNLARGIRRALEPADSGS